MQVAADTVVYIHYTLKNDLGELLDKSASDAPLAYLHGHGNIISGLEEALLGASAGDVLAVRVEAADGYGERHDELVQSVPVGAFDGVESVEPGMRFQAETDSGPHPVVVVEVAGDVVTVDGNHPLAGEVLHFDVEIDQVRSASAEELAHGHVHD
jgi:FKBP-type peptidyl-prolyl cis-trans isomerase SlyD